MAARKKKAGEHPSLFVVPPPPEKAPEYESPVLAERTFHVVAEPEPTPESNVVIEALKDGRFVVSLLREHGTTVAAVLYTRSQLELLLRRIPAALEVG